MLKLLKVDDKGQISITDVGIELETDGTYRLEENDARYYRINKRQLGINICRFSIVVYFKEEDMGEVIEYVIGLQREKVEDSRREIKKAEKTIDLLKNVLVEVQK